VKKLRSDVLWLNAYEETSPYSKKRHHRNGVGEQNNLQAESISYHCDKLEPKEFGELFWQSGVNAKLISMKNKYL